MANFLITRHANVNDMDQARTVFESLLDPPTGVAAPNNHAPHDPPNSPEAPVMEHVYREAYGLVFGGALPPLIGRRWFGSRRKTKDGINAQSAAAFFKTIKEESSIEEVVGALGEAYKWELPAGKTKSSVELDALERTIKQQVGAKWMEVRKIAQDYDEELHDSRRQALVLLVLPTLLAIMDLIAHARVEFRTERSPSPDPSPPERPPERLRRSNMIAPYPRHHASLPRIKQEDVAPLATRRKDMTDVLHSLEEKGDPRSKDVMKALEKWGQVEIVSACFKVIGERIVTPSSIIYLLVKLRISPPGTTPSTSTELTVDETKKAVQVEEETDEKFLASRLDAEELPSSKTNGGVAHAPFWPRTRKPSWWIVLADDKSNRVVVPPMKISDIPYSQPGADRDYRAYKIQFQGPPNTGLFTWKVYIVSDTFVGEEVTSEISLKIEDPPAVEDQPSDDEISEPDEDSIAGQMAVMRGGKVKKSTEEEESEEQSSGTDDDKDDSDSDSDSD
ncbi:hypothetical protein CVT25_009671 [Psilocybe cyanescens]|uniref:SEC63 domain-containing protein n=1 Tax=Psilocybe cyanescens TaxID=93625 RepID=A0A409XD94_PSICY|nr:hypothetical protein CVT25_009671 [Psilocybe cyanescens]